MIPIEKYEEMDKFPKEKPIICIISAIWCKPCLELAKIMPKILNTFDKYFTFCKIDIDNINFESFFDLNDIRKIPTIVITNYNSNMSIIDKIISDKELDITSFLHKHVGISNMLNNIDDF